MSEAMKTDGTIDITDVVCPITFVKVKLALEDLEDGQTLAVHLNDGEPIQNGGYSQRSVGGIYW